MQQTKNLLLLNLTVGAFVLNTFLMRPAALGQSYTSIGLAISCALSPLIFILASRQNKKKHGSSDIAVLILLSAFYLAYTSITSIVFGKADLIYLLKEFLTTLIILATYGAVLVNQSINDKFFSFFSSLISALGYSALITLVLGQFFGMEALHFGALQIKGYESDGSDLSTSTGALYFPFTMVYGRFTAGDATLLRTSGFFREAGIFQAVCCFCLCYEYFNRRSWIVIIGLFVGSLLTLSTAGIAALMGTIGISAFLSGKISLKRISLTILVAAAFVPVLLYAPFIGLNAKSLTHSASITDRASATENGLTTVAENPFGFGPVTDQANFSQVNLIAALGSVGIVGFLLQIIIIGGWRFQLNKAQALKMAACFPLLLTALFSQPLAGAPGIYILSMVAFWPWSNKTHSKTQIYN